jgi:hypothetical protein
MALVIGSEVLDEATPKLKALTNALRNKDGINRVMANGVANLIKKHFAATAFVNRNRFGRPNTFWKRMRDSVVPDSSVSKSEVVMDKAVALRLFGGIVKAKFKKFLTIPLTKDSYGKSARQFNNLFVRDFGDGELYLSRFSGNGKTRRIENLYKLVKRTNHKSDPKVLPTEKDIKAAAYDAMHMYLKRKAGI